MNNMKTIDIRNLKFNKSGKVNEQTYVTRIMGGYIYTEFYQDGDSLATAICFVPMLQDTGINDDNIPTVEITE